MKQLERGDGGSYSLAILMAVLKIEVLTRTAFGKALAQTNFGEIGIVNGTSHKLFYPKKWYNIPGFRLFVLVLAGWVGR